MAEQVQKLFHYRSDPAVTRQEFGVRRALRESDGQGTLYFLGVHHERYHEQCVHYHSILLLHFGEISRDRILANCYRIASVLVHAP